MWPENNRKKARVIIQCGEHLSCMRLTGFNPRHPWACQKLFLGAEPDIFIYILFLIFCRVHTWISMYMPPCECALLCMQYRYSECVHTDWIVKVCTSINGFSASTCTKVKLYRSVSVCMHLCVNRRRHVPCCLVSRLISAYEYGAARITNCVSIYSVECVLH